MTTRKLRISPDLSLPLDAVTQTFGILATRGAGKSNGAAAMAEEMFHNDIPFVAIDPVGSWWGLRSGRDGTPGGGLKIPIFGGKHHDVPLDRGAGEFIADLIAEKRLSCVLDLSEFESEAAKKQFLLAFAKRLYQKNSDPLHLFLEEADDYIPQSPMGDEKFLLRAWENIVRRGRARGLGMTMITQRSAAISKMVLTQVETLFVLRTSGPQDVDAIENWVKYHQVDKAIIKSLSGLEDGEAWVWSPHYLKKTERFRFRLRETFDSGATPKNIRGKEARPAATLADIDLSRVQKDLEATIEKAKAEDPKELRRVIEQQRRRVVELEREVASKQVPAPERLEVPVLSLEDFTKAEAIAERLERAAADASQAANALGVQIDRARASARLPSQGRSAPAAAPREITMPRPTQAASPQSRAPVHAGDPQPGKAERAILTVLAQRHPSTTTLIQAAILTGYAHDGGGFNNAISAARSAGRVTGSRDALAITPIGLAAVPDAGPLPTGRELVEWWMRKLGKAERSILSTVVSTYPRALSKEAIAEATDYAPDGGGFNNALSKLRTLELITRGHEIRASEVFFDGVRS